MKPLAALATLMTAVFVIGALAATEVIDLPGRWRTTLGLAEETPNPPCRLGLYRDSPTFPPAPAGHWRFEPETPKTQIEGSAVAVGPVIYTAGGSRPGNLHTFLAYDTRSGQWSEPSKLPSGLNHSQAVSYRGDLYLAGGYLEGVEPTSRFWRYDPGSNRWAELPSMAQPRGAAGTAVIGDRLYVVDGAPQTYGVSNPGGPYASLEIYDFKSERWSSGPAPPIAVHHLGATSLAGKLYVAGGRTDPEESTDEFLRYDPRTESWKRLPSLPPGKYSSLGVAAAAGKVVVFGGDDELGWKDGDGSVTPSAWAFDPQARRWQRLPDLAIERHAFGAAVVGNRVYAVGGSYCPGLKPNGPVGTHTVESLPASALNGD
ncbi:MAG TPA: kelch repeat-containing protein [Solirubrobacterales bacterium]|nr:kelch repeat-containing protein [Solirubrobacterales bacterium]